MNIEQFKIECKRTCPSLEGGLKLDLAHMVLGMNTEVVELKDAIRNRDEVNIVEEVSDLMWYYCNYLTFREMEIITVSKYLSTDYVASLYDSISELQDYIKKYVAYGKEIPKQEEEECLTDIYGLILGLCRHYGLDLEDGLYKNIEKLKKRFPEKFDAHLAINRDVDAERKILENGPERNT